MLLVVGAAVLLVAVVAVVVVVVVVVGVAVLGVVEPPPPPPPPLLAAAHPVTLMSVIAMSPRYPRPRVPRKTSVAGPVPGTEAKERSTIVQAAP